MLFTKVLYPVLALFSVSSIAFAKPLPEASVAAVADIEARQSTDVLSTVKNLQTTVAPIVDQLNQAAATGKSPSALINELQTAFSGATKTLSGAKKNSLTTADVTATISVSLKLFLDVIIVLGKFSFIDVIIDGNVDVFLNAFISILDTTHPGIAAAIGKGIPSANLVLLINLRLVAVINILGLGGLLGGLLGIIGL
ncbi:hypothetical protein K474DRAFT_135037 [Panus rudis PR-1116 ss-1]|nr:hypothetical protein K474DRAFT_135037 [Panus rudis PR-1116 ss-1]